MRRPTVLAAVLMVTLVVGGAMVAVASADSTPLPEIHTALPTDTYPIKLEGKATQTVEGDIALVNTATKIVSESLTVLYEVKELTSLGVTGPRLLVRVIWSLSCGLGL
jgi:hypothetical protein